MREKETRCKNCNISSLAKNVSINNCGVCNFCLKEAEEKMNYLASCRLQERAMEKLFNKVKTKKRQYDIVVEFSGGTDSSYLIYLLKFKYGLNPLAVTIVYPFVSDKNLKNLDKLAGFLQVDLIKHRLSEEMYKKFTRRSFLFCHQRGFGPENICHSCSFFKHIVAYNLAIEKKIPIFSGGYDKYQSLGCYRENNKIKRLKELLLRRSNLFHGTLNNEYKGTVYDFDIKKHNFGNIPDVIFPLNFLLSYTREIAKNKLMGLGISEDLIDSMSGGCDALPYFNYIALKYYGYGPKEYFHAKMKRQSKINPIAKNHILKIEKAYNNVLKTISISERRKKSKDLTELINKEMLKIINADLCSEIKNKVLEFDKKYLKFANDIEKIEYYIKYFRI